MTRHDGQAPESAPHLCPTPYGLIERGCLDYRRRFRIPPGATSGAARA